MLNTEPIKSDCNNKVDLRPYLTFGHTFAKPKDPIPENRKTHAVYSYHAVTVRKSIWVGLNVSLAHA